MQIVGGESGGVQRVILQVVEQAAVIGIGAGVEGEGYDAAGKTVLRALIVVDELELADGIDRRMVVADGAALVGVHDRDAVDIGLVRVADGTADVQAVVLGVGRIRPRARCRCINAGCEQHEVERITHVATERDGQVLDLLRRDRGADVGGLGLDAGRGGRDGDGLLHLSGLEHEVERDGTADADFDVLLDGGAEAGCLGGDGIVTGREAQKAELAGGVPIPR